MRKNTNINDECGAEEHSQMTMPAGRTECTVKWAQLQLSLSDVLILKHTLRVRIRQAIRIRDGPLPANGIVVRFQ